MTNLTPDQIKQIAALIREVAYENTEESGSVNIEVDYAMNEQSYLIIGEVEVVYQEKCEQVVFKITYFNLELQHFYNEDDMVVLDWKKFKSYL
jgi:hypothetical protein